MSTEWKPGDVGLACGERVAFTDRGWVWLQTGRKCLGQDMPTRPLVVIDPEDREQVERLTDLLWETCDDATAQTDMQAALREFANPTPPKPEEPTGLGAVVEDAEGSLWFRMALENQTWAGEVWQEQYGDADRWTKWADIDAVRALSEGVTP